MIKRIVVSQPARGYVDGRFIGEEKEPRDSAGGGRGRNGRGKANANADSILGSVVGAGRSRSNRSNAGGSGTGNAKGRGKTRGQPRGAGAASDNIGNTTGNANAKPRGRSGAPRTATAGGEASGNAQATRGRGRRPGAAAGQTGGQTGGQGQRTEPRAGARTGQPRSRGPSRPRADGLGSGPGIAGAGGAISGHTGRTPIRKSRGAKKTPFRSSPNQHSQQNQIPTMSPTQGADIRRFGDESKSGQFAEALAASANVKRERLHKILAQSGHGSRRDMEILISSGRLMVNGIVATAGTQVAQGDNVLLDLRPIKLKFSEDLPRVLLYHKPEGEIVTTSDPGNRITVFDNLPKVENGKWTSIGRLDINTSGLLIFTTSGELANRFMHPRYEVEREYAVRILGELTEEQGQRLLSGVEIAQDESKRSAGRSVDDSDEYDEHDDEFAPPDYADLDLGHGQGDDHDDASHNVEPSNTGEQSAGNIGNEHIGNLNSLPATEIDPDAQPAYLAHAPISSHDDHPDDSHGNHDGNNIGNGNQHAIPARARATAAKVAALAKPLRDGLARFDSIEKRGGEGVNQWYHVVIKEGRNREVRKMFEAIGLTVSRLIRIRFGKVELPQRLARGKMMELDTAQVKSVLVAAGMSIEGATAPLPGRAGGGAGAGGKQDRNPKRNGRKQGQSDADGQRQGQGQGQGHNQGQAQGQGKTARPPKEGRDGRDPRPQRNPRTPPRGQRVPRDANEFVPNAETVVAFDENGVPIVAASRGLEGGGRPQGQRDGQREGQHNGRPARGGRGGRGTRGARDSRSAGLPPDSLASGSTGNNHDGGERGNSGNGDPLASQLAGSVSDSSRANDNAGNAAIADTGGALRGPSNGTPRNQNRGRSRRNLRNRSPREPRGSSEPRDASAGDSAPPPPKESSGNE